MMNPMQFMQMIRSGGNPQAIVMQMLNSQGNNPFANNLMQMAKNHDINGLEQIARNMAKEKGTDFDTEYNKFRNMLGM